MTALRRLNLSRNLLDTLPAEVWNPARLARLEGNLLCGMPAHLQTWASTRDPAWREGQFCGFRRA